MNVSEYIANEISKHVDHVFILTGGGAMFLNDAFSWHPNIKPVFCHHEQTCAMAAESYARFENKLGVINVTTGPGGINALNGVFGAWTDSIPMLVFSGQVKTQTTLRSNGLVGKLRQLGDQEVDIVSMVSGITKKAFYVSNSDEVPFILNEAIHLAKSGRPGPVWIDIPINIQSSNLDLNKYFFIQNNKFNKDPAVKLTNLLKKSKRPLLVIGSGVKGKQLKKLLVSTAEKLNIPISLAWTAVDFMSHDHRLFAERSGAVGTRAGNFILQKSDLVIIIGTRLPIRQVSYNWEKFASNAIKFYVDIDYNELTKPMVKPDYLIQSDAEFFIKKLSSKKIDLNAKKRFTDWLSVIDKIKKLLPLIDKDITLKKSKKINPYIFTKKLWELLSENEIVVAADASASVIPFQTAKIKKNQRLYTNAGSASMGYEIPAAIGAAFANIKQRIICLAGGGSLMLNLQDLETIVRYNLPIKIILFNNAGYLSIKGSQNSFFKRTKGSIKGEEINFPCFESICKSNNMDYYFLDNLDNLQNVAKYLNNKKPVFIDVGIDPEQFFQPKLGSYINERGVIESNSLENMSPELDRETFEYISKL